MHKLKVDANTVPEQINIVNVEEQVLSFWNETKAFETQLRLSQGKPVYSFYDGPPFATGLPHYGHILAGTIKDIVTRYASMNGFHVPRTFGWDCHGLPIEHEIDKIHGIKGPEDVKKMGIKQYNDICRSIVNRYSSEWETTVNRLGRWIDFKNDYKTMYPWFMESVWWAFKQIFDKGLVYRSFRVMPYSTACCTPLSNFETGQNYKDIVDPSIVTKFRKLDEQNVYFLAWTTTPWTLPSNLGLVVHPKFSYVKVKDEKSGDFYILLEECLKMVYPELKGYSVVGRFLGSELEGMSYEPVFPYFAHLRQRGAFKVYCDDFVTSESGTGIVQTAPAFGEDDFKLFVLKKNILRAEELPCPVDAVGNFTEPVTDFVGQHVKDADPKVIRHLKERNLVVVHSQHKHSYPFCWRSDTPLIYKAVPSWFIKVESLIPNLLKNNKKSMWVPESVRDKRFHNWLATARDWNISRNRYWGTPIPIWMSDDGEEVVCVGSIEELEKLSGVRVSDLHIENVDPITIPSKMGKGVLRRTPEVFDCWFESGSMPYAQLHYPFENKERFETSFPAHFIGEGIDQTRGWFYTLLVISTAIYDEPPFKNLIVNGLVLAGDGQKMSKRKKNYPDPNEMINKYGADCIRCYLINSPVVRADNLCFKETGLNDLIKDYFLPWFNAFRFFLQSKTLYEKNNNATFVYNETLLTQTNSLVDRWILSYSQSLIKNFRAEMDGYRLYTLIPLLRNYMDQLTKWYIRLNRKTLRGDSGAQAQLVSLNILFRCLYEFCHLAAPCSPFVSEYYFQTLKHCLASTSDESFGSVHFRMAQTAEESLIDTSIEKKFSRFQAVVDLTRRIRERNNLAMKHPLSNVVVVHPSQEFLDDLKSLESSVMDDLNVKQVSYSVDHSKYGLVLTIAPDLTLLGKRFRAQLQPLMDQINQFSQTKLLECVNKGEIVVGEEKISLEEVRILFKTSSKSDTTQYDVDAARELVVLLDVKPSSALVHEGVARDFVNKIQRLRKKAKVTPTDDIELVYSLDKLQEKEKLDKLALALENNLTLIEGIVKKPLHKNVAPKKASRKCLAEETFELAGANVKLSIYQ